ncbi:MAG: zf-HC2 domain-containing protein [Planctomycetota bacterium]
MSNGENQCGKVRELLIDRAMGQLDGPALAAVERHVAACPQCRTCAGELAAADELLSAAPSVAPSKGFDAKLAARLGSERDAERAQRAGVLTMLAAGLRRVRRFELGVAVYPLVLLCLVYVVWAVARREPGFARRSRFDDVPEGRLALVQLQPRPDDPLAVSRVIAEIEKFASREEPEPAGDDPFVPIDPEPAFDPSLAGLRVVREVQAARPAPATVAALLSLPEPAEPVAMTLQTGAPGGSALARARFRRIRDSKLQSARRAISRGVVWLCKNQDGAGFWESGGPGYSREEVTAAAALAFMESGFDAYGRSEPSRHLRAALRWLIRQRRPDGMFGAPGPRQWHAHAMVCMALSESLRLSDHESARNRYRPIVERAVARLAEGQPASGAWGDNNPELTVLVVMAAGSARAAGLAVDAGSHAARLAWLESYRRDRRSPGVYTREYITHEAGKERSYSAIGMILGSPETAWSVGDGSRAAAAELLAAPVVWGAGDFFRWYGGTLAAYELNGRSWQAWRKRVLEELLRNQQGALRTKAAEAGRGSWIPHGITREGGRAYSTAAAVLALTASYGHSPLYGGGK